MGNFFTIETHGGPIPLQLFNSYKYVVCTKVRNFVLRILSWKMCLVFATAYASGVHEPNLGIVLFCFRYQVYFSKRSYLECFVEFHPRDHPVGWFHSVFNHIVQSRPLVEVYYDGAFAGRCEWTTTPDPPETQENGTIALGKMRHPDGREFYQTVQVDELYFFNKELTDSDIETLIQ